MSIFGQLYEWLKDTFTQKWIPVIYSSHHPPIVGGKWDESFGIQETFLELYSKKNENNSW